MRYHDAPDAPDRPRWGGLERPGGAEEGQAGLLVAVQHRHLIVPEKAQHPPSPRRGEQAELVVAHHAAVVGDAERAHLPRKVIGTRHHVGQWRLAVGDQVMAAVLKGGVDFGRSDVGQGTIDFKALFARPDIAPFEHYFFENDDAKAP